MISREQSERLRQAAQIIKEVRATLNTQSEMCTCCDREKFLEYTEAKLEERLAGAQSKLINIAEDIERRTS